MGEIAVVGVFEKFFTDKEPEDSIDPETAKTVELHGKVADRLKNSRAYQEELMDRLSEKGNERLRGMFQSIIWDTFSIIEYDPKGIDAAAVAALMILMLAHMEEYDNGRKDS